MPASTGTTAWNLTMPAGSLQQWLFTFTVPVTLAPFTITGFTWEFVARPSASDLTVPPLISVTPTATAQGVLTVTATASVSSVQLTLNPAATVGLVPQQYPMTLWANPGTASAFAFISGQLIVVGNPQP